MANIEYITNNSSLNGSYSMEATNATSNVMDNQFCIGVQVAYQNVGARLANGAALTLAGMGVVGNLLSIIVLATQIPRTVYVLLLLVLSVADEIISCSTVVFTLTNFIYYFHCSSIKDAQTLYFNIATWVPLAHDVAQLFSNWILVMVSVDRYLAINRPFAGGFSKAKAALVVFFTATGCVLFCLPRVLSTLKIITRNNTIQEPLEILFRYFLPLVLLAVLNGRLLCYIRHAQREHSELTGQRRDSNKSVTVILVLVVVVFLVCGTTRGIYIVIQTGWPVMMSEFWNNFTWILMVVNSSINFIIYVLFYKRFRKTLQEVVLRPCRSSRKKKCPDFTSKTRFTSTTSFNGGVRL